MWNEKLSELLEDATVELELTNHRTTKPNMSVQYAVIQNGRPQFRDDISPMASNQLQHLFFARNFRFGGCFQANSYDGS